MDGMEERMQNQNRVCSSSCWQTCSDNEWNGVTLKTKKTPDFKSPDPTELAMAQIT